MLGQEVRKHLPASHSSLAPGAGTRAEFRTAPGRLRLAAGRSQPGAGLPVQPRPALPADNADEGWCRKHGVSGEALRLAGIVRAELLEVMQRIELPVSPPAFGTDANVLNIQRALISGYFLKVRGGAARGLRGWGRGSARQPLSLPPSLPR